MRSNAGSLWVWVFTWVVALPVSAADYLDESRDITNSPRSGTERFAFTVRGPGAKPHFDLDIKMAQGRAELRILDPRGRARVRMGAKEYTGRDVPILKGIPGVKFGSGMTSGSLMILVGIASIIYWRRRGVAWRWFWIGAGLWLIAVAVKFAIAIPSNRPIYEALKSALPNWAYLTAGSIYGGALTGITEILFVFIAATIWRQLADGADRAVAIGVGAGGFEAALLGIGVIAVAIGGRVGGAAPQGTYVVEVTTTEAIGKWHLRIHDDPAMPKRDSVESASAFTRSLAGPTERVIAILCHVASRALVLLAVARRRWPLFWFGFAWLSGVDALATYFWLTGKVSTLSPWTMEALLVPFAVMSIPITAWCIRGWPASSQDRP